MRGCVQILAGLMAALFVITTVFALFTVNLVQIVTDRDNIKRIADAELLVRNLAPGVLTEVIQEQAEQQGVSPIEVEPAVLRTIVSELLPSGWIDAQTDAAIDVLFDYLETGDPAAASLTIDLRPVVSRLRGEPGRQAILAGLQLLPTCTESQSGFNPETGYFETDSCLPPGVPIAQVATRVRSIVVETVDQSPWLETAGILQIPLLDEGVLAPVARQRLQQMRQLFLLSPQRAWLLWLIPLGALVLTSLLAARSFNDLSYWWGWSLLAAALIALFLAVFLPPFLTATVLRSITMTSESLRASLSQLVQHLLDALIDLWLSRIYIQTGVMSAGGVLLLIVDYVKRTPRRP